MSMSMMMSYLRDERGAEMVEWVVVVAVLSVVAGVIFEQGGVLHGALETGIDTVTSAF